MEQIDLTQTLLWIFATAVGLLVFFIILRLADKDRIFTYFDEKTKVCKYCKESFVRWDYNVGEKPYSIWILPDDKKPIDEKCKCHKVINPEEYANN